MYATVLWQNLVQTSYSCVDVDNISNPNMLTNNKIFGWIPVHVYEI